MAQTKAARAGAEQRLQDFKDFTIPELDEQPEVIIQYTNTDRSPVTYVLQICWPDRQMWMMTPGGDLVHDRDQFGLVTRELEGRGWTYDFPTTADIEQYLIMPEGATVYVWRKQ